MGRPGYSMNYKRILLASHDTPGAQAAEATAMVLAAAHGAAIDHLVVVPDFWKGMTGDDWLNNAATQIRYGEYVEAELAREIDCHVVRLQPLMHKAGITYEYGVRFGRPEQVLIDTVNQYDYDLVVVGSPRPKGVAGLRSRMVTEKVIGRLPTPLTIVPYPVADE